MHSAHTFITLLSLSLAGAQPVITEFVAINSSSQTDGDGNTPDWIEIQNPDPIPLDISGYHLTDDIEIPRKYTFPPNTTIPAGGFLVVFASGRPTPNYVDDGGNLHTNFSLDGDGEYLALNSPGGAILQSFAPSYPPQREDISYGIGNSAFTSTILAEGAASKWLVPTSSIG
ncbi:lamin tail domain-containing protein, partial [Akkermansiaceae bacterium]|nr:lamin tail domain-containing protein [Akkermansiaceae bacterium]